jgi:hypothetical protein
MTRMLTTVTGWARPAGGDHRGRRRSCQLSCHRSLPLAAPASARASQAGIGSSASEPKLL